MADGIKISEMTEVTNVVLLNIPKPLIKESTHVY